MKRALGFIVQIMVYGSFAALIGYLSHAPVYRPIEPGQALIKLSFAYGGKHVGECRTRTQAELEALAPNMRSAKVCSRERVPLTIEFELNGQLAFRDILPPSGLRRDGPSRMYEKFIVPAGRHDIRLRLRNAAESGEWDYQADRSVILSAGDNLAIDFDPVAGGFVFPTGREGG